MQKKWNLSHTNTTIKSNLQNETFFTYFLMNFKINRRPNFLIVTIFVPIIGKICNYIFIFIFF